jgi:hypothetical protein
MKKINSHINKFLKFLDATNPLVDELMLDHNWDDDLDLPTAWIQANWELLVQRELLGEESYLPPIIERTRILDSHEMPTHNLIAKVRDDSESTYVVDGFVTKDGNFFAYRPPFNLASLIHLSDQMEQTRKPIYFPIDEVDFFIMDYKESLSLLPPKGA